ncbi:hypothetical protein NLJ89_g1602 [Agrocybe chaxingu]|uniref:Uncharacterized protein n=1 Tax=Agrocybe chaxingu TaxID=84603 RepID=A0A9W8TEX0_9AGAR|nr:hypothetical protein NLJ89_g1602 [Agrocybe chaxingu]
MASLPFFRCGKGESTARSSISGVFISWDPQSTAGRALAEILGVPYISMDRIMWKPGWATTHREEFTAELVAAMEQDERGWVADGEYTNRGGLLAYETSTDVIWLDPPLLLYFPRIILRTFLRLLRLEEPCSPECPERVNEVFFSKESILWWCISNHWIVRERNRVRMAEIGLGEGTDVEHRRMRRIGGWGTDLKNWLRDVQDMLSSEAKED